MLPCLQGSGQLKLAVRLHKGRVQLFYPRSRFQTQPLQVLEMKSVPVFDGEWHSVVLSVAADRLATRTDCRKRKQRRMRRPFPTLMDIRFDEVHIATCGRRASERFRVRPLSYLQGGPKTWTPHFHFLTHPAYLDIVDTWLASHIAAECRESGRFLPLFLFGSKLGLAEFWIHFMARFGGVHAFGYNFANTEPIWMKSGALWVHCWGLLDPRSSDSWRARRIFVR